MKRRGQRRVVEDDFEVEDEELRELLSQPINVKSVSMEAALKELRVLKEVSSSRRETERVRDEIEKEKLALDEILERENDRAEALKSREHLHYKVVSENVAVVQYIPELGELMPVFGEKKMRLELEWEVQEDVGWMGKFGQLQEEECLVKHLSMISSNDKALLIKSAGPVWVLKKLFYILAVSKSEILSYKAYDLFKTIVLGVSDPLEMLNTPNFSSDRNKSYKLNREEISQWMPNPSDFIKVLQYLGVRDLDRLDSARKPDIGVSNYVAESEMNILLVLKMIGLAFDTFASNSWLYKEDAMHLLRIVAAIMMDALLPTQLFFTAKETFHAMIYSVESPGVETFIKEELQSKVFIEKFVSPSICSYLPSLTSFIQNLPDSELGKSILLSSSQIIMSRIQQKILTIILPPKMEQKEDCGDSLSQTLSFLQSPYLETFLEVEEQSSKAQVFNYLWCLLTSLNAYLLIHPELNRSLRKQVFVSLRKLQSVVKLATEDEADVVDGTLSLMLFHLDPRSNLSLQL